MDRAARIALSRRYLQGWNDRNSQAVLECLHPDIEWDDPAMPERPCRGHDAVRRFMEFTWCAFPDFTVHATPGDEYAGPHEDFFFAPWEVSGTFLGPIDPPGFAPTGRAFRIPGVDTWEVKDGMLWRIHSIYNLIDVLRQVGILAEPGTSQERVLARLQRLRMRITGSLKPGA